MIISIQLCKILAMLKNVSELPKLFCYDYKKQSAYRCSFVEILTGSQPLKDPLNATLQFFTYFRKLKPKVI